MNITKIPDQYTPASGEVVYKIEGADPLSTTDVKIVNCSTNNTIGIKRFSGNSIYNVNIAPYIQSELSVDPITSSDIAILQCAERSIVAKIETENSVAPQRIFTAATYSSQEKTRLSNSPQNTTIAHNQTDEIAFIAGEGTLKAQIIFKNGENQYQIQTPEITSNAGIYALNVNMPCISTMLKIADREIACFNTMEITILENSQTTLFSHLYNLVKPCKDHIRIAWVNPFAGIDYYNFAHTENQTNEFKRATIQNPDGINSEAISASTILNIVSKAEGRRTIEWLSEIAASPQIWIMSDNGAEKVTMDDTNIITQSDDMLRVKLKIRRKWNPVKA